jgi:exopolysaccharide biosynthesis WecB/TagA/CpsF family protein
MILDTLLTDPEDVKKKVLSAIVGEKSLLLTYFNQNCFNIYFKSDAYKKIIDSRFQIYQADLGIFLSLKFLINKKIKKIDATLMNQLIMSELIRRKIPLTIVGGNFSERFILEKTTQSGINLVKYHSGFFSVSQTEKVIKCVGNSSSRVFIIGMGVPRQEIFAHLLSQELNSKVIICVGNFLEFYFETKKRAPVFLRKIGLEWLHRLLLEPKRLWKRYIIGIPIFIIQIVRLKYQRKKIIS